MHCMKHENCCLLGCYIVWSGWCWLIFQRSLLPPASRYSENFKSHHWLIDLFLLNTIKFSAGIGHRFFACGHSRYCFLVVTAYCYGVISEGVWGTWSYNFTQNQSYCVSQSACLGVEPISGRMTIFRHTARLNNI